MGLLGGGVGGVVGVLEFDTAGKRSWQVGLAYWPNWRNWPNWPPMASKGWHYAYSPCPLGVHTLFIPRTCPISLGVQPP